jgi:hypothetical protein
LWISNWASPQNTFFCRQNQSALQQRWIPITVVTPGYVHPVLSKFKWSATRALLGCSGTLPTKRSFHLEIHIYIKGVFIEPLINIINTNITTHTYTTWYINNPHIDRRSTIKLSRSIRDRGTTYWHTIPKAIRASKNEIILM